MHEWGPYDAVGYFTFGTKGVDGETPGLDKLLELYPELAEELIWIIVELRCILQSIISKVGACGFSKGSRQ